MERSGGSQTGRQAGALAGWLADSLERVGPPPFSLVFGVGVLVFVVWPDWSAN